MTSLQERFLGLECKHSVRDIVNQAKIQLVKQPDNRKM